MNESPRRDNTGNHRNERRNNTSGSRRASDRPARDRFDSGNDRRSNDVTRSSRPKTGRFQSADDDRRAQTGGRSRSEEFSRVGRTEDRRPDRSRDESSRPRAKTDRVQNNFRNARPSRDGDSKTEYSRRSSDSDGSRTDRASGGHFERRDTRFSTEHNERLGRNRIERPSNDRDGYQGRRPRSDRDERTPIGLEARSQEPPIPEDFDGTDLPFPVKAELRGLPKELAEIVAAHLAAAGMLIDTDPALAFEHAMAARRRAARLPIVREAAAETAYAAEEYAVALTEYRALYRMNGDPNYLPVLADVERALGRPQAALKLLKGSDLAKFDPALRIEAVLVEAGARDDLGQRVEALRLLKATIATHQGPRVAQARIRYAYADLLERSDEPVAAREWFLAAAKYDDDDILDTDERVALLDGLSIEFGDEPDEDVEANEFCDSSPDKPISTMKADD